MKLWGANYSSEPDATFWEFNRSFTFDRRLLSEEVAASRAYVRALGRCRAIQPQDAVLIEGALEQLLTKARTDPAYLNADAEDVHSFVETRLTEAIGEVAGQAHLGRSRNEQAVTALRLWIRAAIDRMTGATERLVTSLAEKGRSAFDAVMPGFTHTRAAEPIAFGHFMGAHAWALVRDRERLLAARRRVNVLPLGSGALAGTALPISREVLAAELGFDEISPNALDAVTDRDFAAEFVFCCAQLQTHLARLAEDLIWMSGPEYGFFTLPDAYTTGSSLMPQKKNPDSLELVRGKAARVDADLVRLLVLMKGLPAGYQKDLQEDKEAVFDAADTALGSLAVMTGVVDGLGLNREVMHEAASREDMMAAGLAVALARQGVPFRKAHSLVGSWVSEAQRTKVPLREVAARGVADHGAALSGRVESLFDPDEAIRAKAAPGGTSPAAVLVSLSAALARVKTSG